MKNSYLKFFIRILILFLLFILALLSLKFKEVKLQIVNSKVNNQLNFLDISVNKEDLLSSILDYKIANSACKRLEINAESAIGYLLKSDKVVYAKNHDQRYSIASITKLMTAVVAIENMDNRVITFSDRAISAFGDFGGFKIGEKYYKDDLIKGMLVSSSNDASYALAEQLGIKNFVDLMNIKAKNLGMKDTYFVDPAGLSPNNRSSINDLLLLIKYILENHPGLLDISSFRYITIRELSSQKEKIIKNENLFAGSSNFKGGKTGFLLRENKGGLLSLFEMRDEIIVIIVLDDDFYKRYEDTNQILECINNNVL